jgi:phospholipid N-methyltransferase
MKIGEEATAGDSDARPGPAYGSDSANAAASRAGDEPLPAPNPVADALSFFREFLRAPTVVGSVIPTSRSVVEAMLAPVDWANVRLFVEYGPGMGTFTRDILARLAPHAMLIAIDTNLRFVEHLRANIHDRRLKVVQGSALDVSAIITENGHERADYILSGIPFSTLPEGVGPAIAGATHDALRNGGAFLVYQYSRYVRKLLDPHFARIDEERIWLNIPPCQKFVAWKDPVSSPAEAALSPRASEN